MGLAFGISGIVRTAPRTVAGDLSDVLHKHALWITLYATAQYAECHWQIDAHFCGFRCGQLRTPGQPLVTNCVATPDPVPAAAAGGARVTSQECSL
jgi:hypothetical protein